MSATDPTATRQQRATTAALSGVGAVAGAAGLGYAGHKLGQGYRNARALGARGIGPSTRSGALRAAVRHEKFGTALIPLEVAGLGGELMATKILHADAKQQQPKGQTMTKSLGMDQGNGRGRRIVETAPAPVAKSEGGMLVSRGVKVLKPKPLKAPQESLQQMGARMRGQLGVHLEANNVNTEVRTGVRKYDVIRPKGERKAILKSPGYWGSAAAGAGGVGLIAHGERHANPKTLAAGLGVVGGSIAASGVSTHHTANKYRAAHGQAPRSYWSGQPKKPKEVAKARRFDPEADRQRRLGTYAGLAGGAGIITADRFGREVNVARHDVHIPATHKTAAHVKRIPMLGLKRGKRGAALGLATAGLAGVAAGSVRRGISERNQTWT